MENKERKVFRITTDTHTIAPNPQLRGEVIFTPQVQLQRRQMRRITDTGKR